MSIVATYVPLNGAKEFLGLNNNLEEIQKSLENQDYQYGISTKITAENIIRAISELKFKNENGLLSFIKENCDCYMFHTRQKGMLLSMAKYFTLSLTYNYCVKIRLQKNQNLSEKFESEVVYNNIDDINYLIGNPSENLINYLADRKFKVLDNIVVETQEEGYKIEEIYKEGKVISLFNTDLFYSGALIRPLEIKEENRLLSNEGVATINIIFEKSSYGTVFALDNDSAKRHSLISQKDREIIDKFFKEEDNLTRDLLQEEDGIEALDKINLYLKKSNNVHQIVVSANIETSDGILIVPLRNKNAIDGLTEKKGCLYPSVNGNAEVFVPNIDFYDKSSHEDLPCIRIQAGERIDFNKEFTRETYAELKINADPMAWDIYGITLNGKILNKNENTDNDVIHRKMHFNILAIYKSIYDFDKICKLQKRATENYESYSLKGIKLIKHDNMLSFIGKILNKSVDILRRNSDILTSLLSILVFFLSVGHLSFDTIEGISNTITTIVAILLIVASIINIAFRLKKAIRNHQRIFKYYILFDKHNRKKDMILNKIQNKYKLHPATYVLLKLYFTEKTD